MKVNEFSYLELSFVSKSRAVWLCSYKLQWQIRSSSRFHLQNKRNVNILIGRDLAFLVGVVGKLFFVSA
jgi:hypothetical protein